MSRFLFPDSDDLTDAVSEKIRNDPEIKARELYLERRAAARYWIRQCSDSKRLSWFLKNAKADKSVPLVIKTERHSLQQVPYSLSVRNGRVELIAGPACSVGEAIDMLENTPAADVFMLDNSPVKITDIEITSDAVTLDFSRRSTLLVLVAGRTGSGKSTLASAISEKYHIKQLKTFTTRPMRGGEDKKADHYFISPGDVEKYRGDIAAYTKIGDYEYFTTWETLKEEDAWVYVIDPAGVECLKRSVAENNMGDSFHLATIYVALPPEQRLKRLAGRGDDAKTVLKRLKDEEKQFMDFEKHIAENDDVFIIRNHGTVEQAMEQLENIFIG